MASSAPSYIAVPEIEPQIEHIIGIPREIEHKKLYQYQVIYCMMCYAFTRFLPVSES